LDGRVAVLLDRGLDALGELARLGPADALVDPDLLPALAAQQPVDGQADRLAGDVPQRLLDPADRRVEHRAAREPAEVVQHRPEVLDVAWVLPDEPILEVMDRGNRRLVRPARIRLADAADALVEL